MNLDELKQTSRRLRRVEAAAARAAQQAEKKVDDELCHVRACERHLEDARDRAALDTAQTALESAIKEHALALRRLKDRQGEHADAELQAHGAAVAVVRCVDQLLADEIADRSKRIEHHLNEALRLGTALKYFAVAAGVHSTELISPSTLAVLDRLHLPMVSPMDVPINMAKLGDTTAFREWTARRSALINGDGEIGQKAA